MAKMRYKNEQDKLPKLSVALVGRILAYFGPYKLRMAGIVLLLLAAAVLGLVPPMLLQQIVDTALPGRDLARLALLVALSIGATALLNLLRVGQGYLSTWVSKRITFHMKNQMFAHLCRMPAAFFAGVKPGDITTRMNSDIDGIQEVFRTTVVNAVSSVLVLGTTLFALFSMNWKLALVGLATVPLFILPTRKVGKVRWQITAQSQQLLSGLNQQVQESLSSSGSTLMKLSTMEEEENRAFARLNSRVTELQVKETLAGRWFRMAMDVFTTIGPMLVYLVGGLLLVQGEMSIGGILTFATLLGRLYGPVTQISNIHIDFMRSFALFGRIFAYLDMPVDICDGPDGRAAHIEKGEVRYENICFAYGQQAVLRNITFAAGAGQTVAIVGPSGAGKSTLTSLLPRLYDAQQGSIFIDDTPHTQMTLHSLRSQIGVVTQEPYLFNGTILQNLMYGNAGATQAQIEAACRAAYIHGFIQGLPQGYHTEVGNRGMKLSGGEKQRIAIARILLKNPKLLILDEATSALDTLSEYYVQKAMDKLLQGRTSFVIAHRLSTVQNADKILVMDKGAIVQQGTHAELMGQKGLYSHLHSAQFKQSPAA